MKYFRNAYPKNLIHRKWIHLYYDSCGWNFVPMNTGELIKANFKGFFYAIKSIIKYS